MLPIELLARKRFCLRTDVKEMAQVQVRVPEKLLKEIDRWVAERRYASRSDAIKTILAIHQERERTRQFYSMLMRRRKEAREKPDILVPLDEID